MITRNRRRNRRGMNRRNNYRDYGQLNTGTRAGGSRACLCPDGQDYSIECCDGSLWAQGIGRI